MKQVIIKELKSYFNSPIAYIFIIVFLVLTYGLFIDIYFLQERNEMRSYFAMAPLIFVIFIPAVTMRLWSEERKMGTIELLLTLPLTRLQLVGGKYIASLLFLLATLAASLPIPIMMFVLGSPDTGPIIGGYLGLFLLGAELLAIGMFLSTLCKDQIIAFITSLIVCAFLYLTGDQYFASMLDNTAAGFGKFLYTYFSIPPRFESIQRGVIELRDLFYFIIMSVAFFILTVYYLEGHIRVQSKQTMATVFCLMLTSCAFANMIVSEIHGYRIDFTKDNVYTIPKGTKKIAKELTAELTITYFVTGRDEMPSQLATLERDTMDLLNDIASLSNRIVINRYYPEKADAKVLERMKDLNVRPFKIEVLEERGITQKLIYSAILLEYLDKAPQIINPVVPSNMEDLEYRIMSRVYRMLQGVRPEIAVVGPKKDPDLRMVQMGIGSLQTEDRYETVTETLRDLLYDVKRIRLDRQQNIAEDKSVDVMVVFAPYDGEFNERRIYEVTKRLAEGTSCIVAMSGVHSYFDPAAFKSEVENTLIATKLNKDFIAYLERLGVTVEQKFVMDENTVTDRVVVQRFIGQIPVGQETKTFQHPTNFKILEGSMNKGHPITSKVKNLTFIKGSPIRIDKDKLAKNGLKVTVLATTSARSWVLDHKQRVIPAVHYNAPEKFEGEIPLAVLIEGQFPFEFEGKSVPEWDGEKNDKAPKAPKITKRPSKLLLITSAEMFIDHYMRLEAEGFNNLAFITSAVDYLTGGDALLTIKKREVIAGQIKQLDHKEKQVYKFGFGLAGPAIVIAIGLFRYGRRLKRRIEYKTSLARKHT